MTTRRGVGVGIALVCLLAGTAGADPGQALVDAAAAHDAAAIEKLFDTTVEYGGMWFLDGACRAQLPSPGAVHGNGITALAACLAQLPLASTGSETGNGVVLSYAPGLAIDVQYTEDAAPKISWIGYAARQDVRDALPTITTAAFEALRGPKADPIEIDSDARDEIKQEIAADGLREGYAWFKVCINGTGAVTGVHLLSANSAVAAGAYADELRRLELQPFKIAGRALPVCALERFGYPATVATAPSKQPGPGLKRPGVPAYEIAPNMLAALRISGDTRIVPTDRIKSMIRDRHIDELKTGYKLCIDASGNIDEVTMLQSSGFYSYDRELMHKMRAWKYRPFLLDGKPTRACTAVTFFYSQR